jgi:predicted peptidase
MAVHQEKKTTRREAVRFLASAPIAAWITGRAALLLAASSAEGTPPLSPGSPMSAERMAVIDEFKKRSDGIEKKYEARTYKSNWTMPYQLFRPEATGKLPLVVYLHGSGGQGDDNEKQLGLGNIFGTRVWLLPENQKKFPCYVLAPQSNRGWVRYDPAKLEKGIYEIVPGPGQGVSLALEVIDAVRHDFAIDHNRIYVTGQSMGGAGTWNMIASRPEFFAAAAPCCGATSNDDGTGSIETPLWNFHGDSDQTVPVALSRDRIAARRRAGGHPFSTEYAGVDHNVWQWAYTEPALVSWIFSQRRSQVAEVSSFIHCSV